MSKRAYVTLITRSSYLPGVVILAHTLRKHHSPYPLVVFYTVPTLDESAVEALGIESRRLNLVLKPIDALSPRRELKLKRIAERFDDTWTKLQVFQLTEYDTLCFLDADMLICRNPDDIFDVAALPGPDWIASSQCCVCNLEQDSWAPKDYSPENCAHTYCDYPQTAVQIIQDSPRTFHHLNSGMFLFHPSEKLWQGILHYFNTSPALSDYLCPDQDFLADFFHGRWVSVGWRWNALKTMYYRHSNMWRDEEVRILHFIVDKPWVARVKADGTAGYAGKDGVTHGWWWAEYDAWHQSRVDEWNGLLNETVDGDDHPELEHKTREVSQVNGNSCSLDRRKALRTMLDTVEKFVAGDDGSEPEGSGMLGSKVQDFAKNMA